MKYIVLILVVITIFLTKPWEISFAGARDTDNTDSILFIKPAPQSYALFPINKVINNSDSEFAETQQLDRIIKRFMNKWHIQGTSFALMKDGKLIYCKGYGYADAENNTETDVQHIFRIASISKLITAVGVMKLVEDSKLHLDDKVFGTNGILNDSIYSEIKDPRIKNITVEHLLRHQGGFTTAYGDPMFCPADIAEKMKTQLPIDLTQTIQFVLSRKLRFNPGAATNYSNVGYGILSKVIEKVTGLSYEAYIQMNILRPASCFDMHLGHNLYENKFPNEVRYYAPEETGLVLACDGSKRMVPKYYGGNNIEELYGAGGWVASPSELLRFLTAIDGKPETPDILKPETISYMTECHINQLPIGWMNTTPTDWTRTGTLSGTSAMLKLQEDGYAWAFITNTSNWYGPRFTRMLNATITEAIQTVKSWPERNLFELQQFNHTQLLVKQ